MTKTTNDKLNSSKIYRLMSGFQISQAIYVAAKLGIADLLAQKAKNYQELAKAKKADPISLYRLLRCLASFGIFKELKNGYFKLTPLSMPLLAASPNSMRNFAIFYGELVYQVWSRLLYSIQTSKTAFKNVFQKNVFDYLDQNKQMSEIFNKTMIERTTQTAMEVASAYNFSKFHTIVDVGGGCGALIVNILKTNRRLSGILFDLPATAAEAKRYIKNAGLLKHCKIIEGNFFKTIPSGGDCYLLSRVIHDWDDKHAIIILKNCRKVMQKNGKLLLIEELIQTKNKANFSCLRDLHMLAMNGGQERTKDEYKKLLHLTGFQLTRLIPIHYSANIIEATPICKRQFTK